MILKGNYYFRIFIVIFFATDGLPFLASAAPVVLSDIPAYNWYHGCGPTSAGSIFGYWDLRGYPNLFDAQGWDEVSLRANVEDQISSPEHNAKYDSNPDDPVLPDPPDTSIADFFHTSEGDLDFGWSDRIDAQDAFIDYAEYKGYEFSAANYFFKENPKTYLAQFHWDQFVAEIDADRPVQFHVDTNGDGVYDHMVPAFGYDDRGGDGLWYAYFDTYGEDETILWSLFRFKGDPWGIEAATFVTPVSEPTMAKLTDFSAQVTGGHILLKWETASEVDNVGFHIWRSLSADGSYERLTPILIPAKGGPSFGASYEWIDDNALFGLTYFYKLEDIEHDGDNEFHGPVSAPIDLKAGDVSGDGKVTLGDAIIALRVTAGMSPGAFLFRGADVDGNSRIGLAEAVFVMEHVADVR